MNKDKILNLIIKHKKISISFTIIFLILLPLILDLFVFNNNIYSKASNDGWASFFGSYLGGIFGGIATLAAVLISIKETRDIQKENDKANKAKDEINAKKELERERLRIMPILSIENNYCKHTLDIKDMIETKFINMGGGLLHDLYYKAIIKTTLNNEPLDDVIIKDEYLNIIFHGRAFELNFEYDINFSAKINAVEFWLCFNNYLNDIYTQKIYVKFLDNECSSIEESIPVLYKNYDTDKESIIDEKIIEYKPKRFKPRAD